MPRRWSSSFKSASSWSTSTTRCAAAPSWSCIFAWAHRCARSAARRKRGRRSTRRSPPSKSGCVWVPTSRSRAITRPQLTPCAVRRTMPSQRWRRLWLGAAPSPWPAPGSSRSGNPCAATRVSFNCWACRPESEAPMAFFTDSKKLKLPASDEAVTGRRNKMPVPDRHFVNGRPLVPPFPEGIERAVFGMGCFWGAEKKFWPLRGVFTTAVGYSGGFTPNPTYREVCSGQTGHAEVVLVAYDPREVAYEELLRVFWESHDPTQGMRQGNDVGTQYRSAIYGQDDDQKAAAEASLAAHQGELRAHGYGGITTEIAAAGPFYYAEEYHQQYLANNPEGYCGLGGTGVTCPVGVATRQA